MAATVATTVSASRTIYCATSNVNAQRQIAFVKIEPGLPCWQDFMVGQYVEVRIVANAFRVSGALMVIRAWVGGHVQLPDQATSGRKNFDARCRGTLAWSTLRVTGAQGCVMPSPESE